MIDLKLIMRVIISYFVLYYFMEEAPLLLFIGHEEAVIDRHDWVLINPLVMTVSMRKVGSWLKLIIFRRYFMLNERILFWYFGFLLIVCINHSLALIIVKGVVLWALKCLDLLRRGSHRRTAHSKLSIICYLENWIRIIIYGGFPL
jgi:hypothetical protein